MRSRSIGRGLTLVELLVVIAIIGILVALLLPAVQAAREAGRRMQCQSNEKQVGIALQNYHDTHRSFPVGHHGNVSRANWRVMLFPFMEQSPLYDNININDVYSSVPLRKNVISIWKCPSQAVPDTQPQSWVTWWTNYEHQVPSYIGIMGAYPDPNGNAGAIYNSNYGGWWSNNGMLLANEATSFASCIDGSSNTIMVGEQSARVGLTQDVRNGYFTPWGGVTFGLPIGRQPAGADCWGMGLTCVAYAINSRTTAAGSDTSYKGNSVLNSSHPGGINVIMGDGSVQFVAQTMDFTTFQRLCTKSDGFVASLQ
jgi:prepilin-type N-terminal cleavage/methylation domain-containing protein